MNRFYRCGILALSALGCQPQTPAPAAADQGAEFAAAGAPVLVERIIHLDPGEFIDGYWSGMPSPPVFVSFGGAQLADGQGAEVAIGWATATVYRKPCSPAKIPVRVDPAIAVVSVPYPVCGAALDAPALPSGVRLDRREFSNGRLRELLSIGLLPDAPRPDANDDVPAHWLTRDEAEAACGFYGGRLMARGEWMRAGGSGSPHLADHGPIGAEIVEQMPSLGPYGHIDLDGNTAEWTEPEPEADGQVVGGSWLRPGATWQVPSTARSDEIGFRCAYPADSN